MTAVPQALNSLNVIGDGYISIGNTSRLAGRGQHKLQSGFGLERGS